MKEFRTIMFIVTGILCVFGILFSFSPDTPKPQPTPTKYEVYPKPSFQTITVPPMVSLAPLPAQMWSNDNIENYDHDYDYDEDDDEYLEAMYIEEAIDFICIARESYEDGDNEKSLDYLYKIDVDNDEVMKYVNTAIDYLEHDDEFAYNYITKAETTLWHLRK